MVWERRGKGVFPFYGEVAYLGFHPTAGFCVFESFFDDFGKVREAAEEEARVDVVESVGGVEPVFFVGIIDYELDIFGDPALRNIMSAFIFSLLMMLLACRG